MLLQFILGDNAIRGRIVRLDKAYQKAMEHHDYPQKVTELLGQTIALGTMMGSNVKEEGILTLQLQGSEDSAARLMVMELFEGQQFRATARIDREKVEMQGADATLETLFGLDAIMVCTMDFKLKERYQSVASLAAQRLDAAVEQWQNSSNQIGNFTRLEADEKVTFGLMLEPIATQDLSQEAQALQQEQWSDAQIFAQSLTNAEIFDENLSLESILYRLFNELGVHVVGEQDFTFACRCSEEKLIDSLKNLIQQDDGESLFNAEGYVEVTCEYCNKSYYIMEAQLTGKKIASNNASYKV